MKTSPSKVLILLLICIACDDDEKKSDFVEGFDDVPALIYNGWAIKDNSSPMWDQGKSTAYGSAQSGEANSFLTIHVPFMLPPNTSSSWVITPVMTMKSGDRFMFYTVSNGGAEYDSRDRFQVRRNTKSTDVNVGDMPGDVGDFTTLLLDVNPTEELNYYPNEWVKYEVTKMDLPEPKKGRLAFRYSMVESHGNSNGISLDSVAYVSR